ncbi:anthrone oxygenase family protein (plasmid) [Streptomyces sp. BI20]|uniref:anthrone oxygenase family protein n=1 Tax=Streptomyces sp. BI20 TaxID=3403460 RepID=UPI003C713A3F
MTTSAPTAPRPDRWTTPLLAVAALTAGLMAGIFLIFDIAITPGLAELADPAHAQAMAAFNRLIDGSALFVLVFLLPLPSAAVAAFTAWRAGRAATVWWAVAAGVSYLVVLVLTFAVNIPLNDELAALGTPAPGADLSVLERFDSVWRPANTARTVFSFLAAAGALVAVTRPGPASRGGSAGR